MITAHTVETYDRDSVVIVAPFTRQVEGDEVIIGNLDSATFIAVPSGAVEVLDYLATGMSVGEAGGLYLERHGEVCDIEGLLRILETKRLVGLSVNRRQQNSDPVAEPAGHPDVDRVDLFPAHASRATARRGKRYRFSSFPQTLALRIFSSQTIGAALILILISVLLLANDRSLWPRCDDLYYTHRRTLNLFILAALSYLGVLIHEFAHLIAARAAGVSSTISFGNRLYQLVIEADLTRLWSVPKRERYLPLLAGCLADAVTLAILILILWSNRNGWLEASGVAQLLRTIVLSYAARLMWQGMVFVRTDVYYVVATLLNCRNLLQDTEDYLRNRLALVVPWIRIVDQSAIGDKERIIIRFYALIWIGGRVIAMYYLYVVAFPMVCRYGKDLANSLATYSINPSRFWDEMAVAVLLGLPSLIGCILWVRTLVRTMFPRRPQEV